MLENTSKLILIIVDFNKNNCLLTSMKQLPLELFKSVAFFWDTRYVSRSCVYMARNELRPSMHELLCQSLMSLAQLEKVKQNVIQ